MPRAVGIPVGPGRGSAAGSIVSYCLHITDIDPMKYGLFFERFLNPERVSMPDIDMDFGDTRRGEVVDYVRRKYGDDHVAQIVTFGTMAARGAIRDVGRALNMTYADVRCDRQAGTRRAGKSAHHAGRRPQALARAARKVRGRRAGEKAHRHGAAPWRGCPATPPPTPPAWSSPSAPWYDYVPAGDERRRAWSASTS